MNKKGFTLIEIIIVIVILGILATLALPRLTAQIDTAQGAEAMQFFGVAKRAASTCYETTANFGLCNSQNALSIMTPQNPKYSYSIATAISTLTITARAIVKSANEITMTVNDQGVTNFYAPATSVFVGIANKTGASAVIVQANSANVL